MSFIKVAKTSEIPVNSMKTVKLQGVNILLANIEGALFAIPDKCTHLGGPLGKGKLEGSTVTCPWHGAKFDVRTGEALGEAKIGFIKMKVKDQPSLAIKVEGEEILVDIP